MDRGGKGHVLQRPCKSCFILTYSSLIFLDVVKNMNYQAWSVRFLCEHLYNMYIQLFNRPCLLKKRDNMCRCNVQYATEERTFSVGQAMML